MSTDYITIRSPLRHEILTVADPASRWRGVLGKLGVFGIAAGIPVLLGSSHLVQDAFVLAILVLTVAGTARGMAALLSVLLAVVAFPPFALPTYWFCLAPLAWIWRDERVCRSMRRCCLEAVAIGFASAWMSTAFVREAVPVLGAVAHSGGCFLFGCQMLGVAVSLRLLRHKPVLVSAAVAAVAATCCELLQARYGVAWEVMSLSLPAAPTPVAQWACLATPFGVSLIIYLANFLCLPDGTVSGRSRWLGPLAAFSVAVSAWMGGLLIASEVPVAPLPFSAMLVQPHVRQIENMAYRPWLVLDRITQSSLQADGPVDLIVWPEATLSPSASGSRVRDWTSIEDQLTLQDFSKKVFPRYQTAALVGVVLSKPGKKIRYGLTVNDVRFHNCGCLASPSGEIVCHEKLVLVPMKEGLPDWLDRPWFRRHILRPFHLEAPLSPGRRFKRLPFTRRDGTKASVSVSICYELYMPWLPQYRNSGEEDAIIHLVYDGYFADHPGCTTRQLWACQYRAIETRKWNFLCTTWAGSAVIDPKGQVLSRLSGKAGVIRTDAARMTRQKVSTVAGAAHTRN